MIQELDLDYDINVNRMIPISQLINPNDLHINGFEVVTAQFSTDFGKLIDMQILAYQNFQIFAMNDGLDNPTLFILEVDDGVDVSYYHSIDLDELTLYANNL
jgi:hypothetical protein